MKKIKHTLEIRFLVYRGKRMCCPILCKYVSNVMKWVDFRNYKLGRVGEWPLSLILEYHSCTFYLHFTRASIHDGYGTKVYFKLCTEAHAESYRVGGCSEKTDLQCRLDGEGWAHLRIAFFFSMSSSFYKNSPRFLVAKKLVSEISLII